MIIRSILAAIFCIVTQSVFSWNIGSQAYFAMYGDITTIEDLFLPDLLRADIYKEDTDTDDNESNESNINFRRLLDDSIQIDSIEKIFNIQSSDSIVKSLDEKQLLDLDSQALNISRRLIDHFDPIQFSKANKKDTVSTESKAKEEFRKIKALKNVGLSFLIHTRREVQRALDQRQIIRYDKRYRLGYLFNRVRRLRLEMAKVINGVHGFMEPRQRYDLPRSLNVSLLIRAYEQVSRYDIDIRDTLNLIKTVYNEPAVFDYN